MTARPDPRDETEDQGQDETEANEPQEQRKRTLWGQRPTRMDPVGNSGP